MRIRVRAFEPFECPYCGQRYELHVDDEAVVLLHESGGPCPHVDLEIFPNGDGYEVYFADVEWVELQKALESLPREEVVSVRVGEPFECPYCGQRYHMEGSGVCGEPCRHIWGPFPTVGEWFFVWFVEEGK